jgi:hypothetical protein
MQKIILETKIRDNEEIIIYPLQNSVLLAIETKVCAL